MKQDRSWLLGNERIGKLLWLLSAPAMVGMMVQSLYNVVDTFFVGRFVGYEAIGGISIAFPVQMLTMAILQTIGIGSASIISRALGAKEKDKAERTLGNAAVLVLIVGLSIAVPGLIFIDFMVKFFGATPEIAGYTREYLSIIFFGTVFFAYAVSHNNIIRSEGNARISMNAMIISGAMNIVLDAFFVVVLRMGVKGAAIATVISQISTATYILIYFLFGQSLVRYRVKNFILNMRIVKEILAVGSPAFIRMGAGSVIVIVMNHLLGFYGGALAISTFGVIHRLSMFSFMPLMGVVQGFQPIAGFNYGAKKIDRLQEAIKISLRWTTVYSVIVFSIMMLIPRELISIFSKEEALLDLGAHALRITMLLFPFLGMVTIATGLFQALGKAIPAIILAMARQVAFVLPAMLILPKFFKLDGVWMAFPMADSLALILTAILFIRELKIINTLAKTTEKVKNAKAIEAA
ncbi:MAG: MATE family efflux transporter [Acidobacteria bacterium]|nr:MATE family efflux transporter [Acidobacteriota bacterium]